MTPPPTPASTIPTIAILAGRVPGRDTLKTQIPMLALTSRLSWAIVKPAPVPTSRPGRAGRRCRCRTAGSSGCHLKCGDPPAQPDGLAGAHRQRRRRQQDAERQREVGDLRRDLRPLGGHEVAPPEHAGGGGPEQAGALPAGVAHGGASVSGRRVAGPDDHHHARGHDDECAHKHGDAGDAEVVELAEQEGAPDECRDDVQRCPRPGGAGEADRLRRAERREAPHRPDQSTGQGSQKRTPASERCPPPTISPSPRE